MKNWQAECGCLASTCLGNAKHVLTRHDNGNSLLLNWCGCYVPSVLYGLFKWRAQFQIGKGHRPLLLCNGTYFGRDLSRRLLVCQLRPIHQKHRGGRSREKRNRDAYSTVDAQRYEELSLWLILSRKLRAKGAQGASDCLYLATSKDSLQHHVEFLKRREAI